MGQCGLSSFGFSEQCKPKLDDIRKAQISKFQLGDKFIDLLVFIRRIYLLLLTRNRRRLWDDQLIPSLTLFVLASLVCAHTFFVWTLII
jgi:hypothetical protein